MNWYEFIIQNYGKQWELWFHLKILCYIPRKLAKYVWKCDEYWTSGFEVSGSLHVSLRITCQGPNWVQNKYPPVLTRKCSWRITKFRAKIGSFGAYTMAYTIYRAIFLGEHSQPFANHLPAAVRAVLFRLLGQGSKVAIFTHQQLVFEPKKGVDPGWETKRW